MRSQARAYTWGCQGKSVTMLCCACLRHAAAMGIGVLWVRGTGRVGWVVCDDEVDARSRRRMRRRDKEDWPNTGMEMMNVRLKVALGHVGEMSGAVIRHEKSRASPRPTSMGARSARSCCDACRGGALPDISKFWPRRRLDCVFNDAC